MDDQVAWFCVTDEAIDVYDLEKYPFVWTTQYVAAKELIILPLDSLIKLAEEDLQNPDLDIIMLFNSARSGSTLACQMFDRLPRTKSMSEPWIGTNLYIVLRSSNVDCDIDRLVRACINVQCKQSIKEPFDRVIFKPSLTASGIVGIISLIFECIVILFVFRYRW